MLLQRGLFLKSSGNIVEQLIEKFVEMSKKAIEVMMQEDSQVSFCEETYSKFRSIFMMFDIVNLITQRNKMPENLVAKMKEIVEEKLSTK